MLQECSPADVQAEARTEETRQFIRRVRRATRRKFTPEEKVRIVLEGFRGGMRVRELCRQESIRRGSRGPGGIRAHDSRVWSPASRDEPAPTACLKSRRPPKSGPRLACVVTSNAEWSGRRGSNPRQPAWKEEGHPSRQA